jgi:hypothetical protein
VLGYLDEQGFNIDYVYVIDLATEFYKILFQVTVPELPFPEFHEIIDPISSNPGLRDLQKLYDHYFEVSAQVEQMLQDPVPYEEMPQLKNLCKLFVNWVQLNPTRVMGFLVEDSAQLFFALLLGQLYKKKRQGVDVFLAGPAVTRAYDWFHSNPASTWFRFFDFLIRDDVEQGIRDYLDLFLDSNLKANHLLHIPNATFILPDHERLVESVASYRHNPQYTWLSSLYHMTGEVYPIYVSNGCPAHLLSQLVIPHSLAAPSYVEVCTDETPNQMVLSQRLYQSPIDPIIRDRGGLWFEAYESPFVLHWLKRLRGEGIPRVRLADEILPSSYLPGLAARISTAGLSIEWSATTWLGDPLRGAGPLLRESGCKALTFQCFSLVPEDNERWGIVACESTTAESLIGELREAGILCCVDVYLNAPGARVPLTADNLIWFREHFDEVWARKYQTKRGTPLYYFPDLLGGEIEEPPETWCDFVTFKKKNA